MQKSKKKVPVKRSLLGTKGVKRNAPESSDDEMDDDEKGDVRKSKKLANQSGSGIPKKTVKIFQLMVGGLMQELLKE